MLCCARRITAFKRLFVCMSLSTTSWSTAACVTFHLISCSFREHVCWLKKIIINKKFLKITSNNLQSVAQNQAVVRKWKASSVVWNYFGFTSNDVEQHIILCKLCRTTVFCTKRQHHKVTECNTRSVLAWRKKHQVMQELLHRHPSWNHCLVLPSIRQVPKGKWR